MLLFSNILLCLTILIPLALGLPQQAFTIPDKQLIDNIIPDDPDPQPDLGIFSLTVPSLDQIPPDVQKQLLETGANIVAVSPDETRIIANAAQHELLSKIPGIEIITLVSDIRRICRIVNELDPFQ
jgi:hypothetical protein